MRQHLINPKLCLVLLGLFVLGACTQEPSADEESGECIRPTRSGCFVSMYEVVSSPKRFEGKRVSFVAFYAPAFGRPTFFLNKDGWLLSDTPSAIVVSQISEEFYHREGRVRFSYVRASGVIGANPVKRIEPHISLHDVSIQPITQSDDLARIQRALESEAEIGFTEEEYHRLNIENSRLELH